MLCISICAFREPFEGGFVEAVYSGQEVDVPEGLVERLASDGHIRRLPAPLGVGKPDGSESSNSTADTPAPARKRK